MKNSICKKIMLISLSILMCLNTLVSVNAASTKVDYSKDIELLKLLDIVDDSVEADKFIPTEAISRATFATYFAKLVNIDTKISNATLYYNDVPDTHYAFNEITALTTAGYFTGAGNKLFLPEIDMQIQYTFKLFATALGANSIVEFNKADPNAALKVCEDLGVLDGVSTYSGALTEGDMFKMMANALLIKAYGIDKPGGSLAQSERSLLYSTRHMVYVKTGVITAVGSMSLNNKSIDDKYCSIDNVEYLLPDFDVEPYIGRTVRYIYKATDKQNDEPTLVWVDPIKDNEVMEIEVTPDCSFDKTTRKLSYYDEEDHEKKIEIPTGIVLLYNGEYKGKNVDEVFNLPRYNLRLVKDFNTGKFTTAIVWKEDFILVDYLDLNEKIVYDRLSDNSYSLDEEEYESLKILGTSGHSYDITAIAKNNLLSIYQSDSGKYSKVVVSALTVNGPIQSILDKKVKVDGKIVEFYDSDFKLSYKVGQSVVAYLSTNGYIVSIEKAVDKNDTVGYMIKCTYDEDTDVLTFRMLLSDNTFKTFTAADKIVVNEKTFRDDHAAAYKALKDGAAKVIPQIVKYKANEDKFTSIDFASEDDGKDHALYVDDVLAPYSSADSTAAYSYIFSFKAGRKMGINNDTVIFVVPEPNDEYEVDEKYCYVGYPGNGIHEDTISYRTTKEPAFFEQYIVYTMAGGSGAGKMTTIPAMYDSSYLTVNADDEPIKVIIMYNIYGSKMELEVSSDFDVEAFNLQRGDILNYKINPLTNQVNSLEFVCGPTKTPAKRDWEQFTAENRTLYAYLHSIEDGGIRVGYESGIYDDEIIIYSGSVVYFDKDKDKVLVGTPRDLKPGTAYGNASSAILTTSTYGATNGMFAIK